MEDNKILETIKNSQIQMKPRGHFILQAMLMLVGLWYENREAATTEGGPVKEIPMAVESLLLMHRVWGQE